MLEGTFPTTLAVVTGADGVAPLVSQIVTPSAGVAGTGWDLYVFNLSANEGSDVTNPTTAIYSSFGQDPGNGSTGPLFNSLQLDGYWEENEEGYNWRYTLDMTQAGLTTVHGGHKLRICARLNRSVANGGPIVILSEPDIVSVVSA